MKEKRSSFSWSIGFVLAAAGSAVGVGNIWRFPYLCAKDGGGLFLLVYLVLVLTFGFVLLTTDVAIGRKTKKNALKAFEELNPKWKFLGRLTFLVPVLISINTIGAISDVIKDVKYPSAAASIPSETRYTNRYFVIQPPITE